ncbi:MAG: hypothetical protein R2848_18695 [Thermomicrobiales bacterium]
MPTDRFLEGLGFTPVNPPNAAAVVRTPEGERDVLVVELFNPVYTREYDADGGQRCVTTHACWTPTPRTASRHGTRSRKTVSAE